MDLKTFVEALTIQEIHELSNILWDKKKEIIGRNLQPLSQYQMDLVNQNKFILAIKAYREMYNSSLLEAKLAVDAYRNR